MSSSSSNYACPCLNVQIRTRHPPSPSSLPPLSDPYYQPVYVSQDGIAIVHPQLTLRSRTHSKHQPDPGHLCGHTSLTCLICRLSIYRVLQSIPSDMDVTEGPVLATEEWVGHEVLQSGSGWIELARQCLTDESVALAQTSEAYSPIFRVVLPTPPNPIPLPPPPPSFSTSQPSSPEPRKSDCPPKVLPPLSPLFPPPPFVPSHPTFDHLSAVALQRSDQLRKTAEEQLSQIVQARVLKIEEEEEELRRQVQLLWAAFREAEAVLTQDTKLQPPEQQPTTSDSAATASLSHASHESKLVSPVAISDFIPVSTVRSSSPAYDPHPSALATSLAASSFHHPEASSERRRSTSPIAATTSSPLPTSPTLVGSINYRDPIRRDMNENKDIATSFRYAVDMEAERSARTRQYQSLSNVKSPGVNTKVTSDPNPAVAGEATEHSGPVTGPSTSKIKASSEELLSPSRSKGKRKVTFDIKPVVPGGEREAQVDEGSGEASIFELEDDRSDTSQRDTYDGPTLTLRDPIDSPTRPHRQPRASGGAALPHPLQSLRPTSLPATVALRSSDIPHPESSPQKNATPPSAAEDIVSVDVDEALSPRDQELARLVNVITPSHRNAWKRDSQSWKLFGSSNAGDASPESPDDETDATAVSQGVEPNGKHAPFNLGVSASLPISIGLSPRDHIEDGLVDEQHNKPENAQTSASYRKASYAARDRSRSLDPGTLDFESGGDDEGIDGDDSEAGSLSRGRRRALKILQARSELPDEGMWRSLAS